MVKKLFFAPFTRVIWALFGLLLFTQLNWITVHHRYYDALLRVFGAFFLAVPAAVLLHFILVFFLLPFFKNRSNRLIEFTGGLCTPLLAFYGFLPLFFSSGHGSETARIVFYLFVGLSIPVWIIMVYIKRKPALKILSSELKFNLADFIKKLAAYYGAGILSLLNSIMLKPKILTNENPRYVFQPYLYPLLILHGMLLVRFGFIMTNNLMLFLALTLLTTLSLVLLVNIIYFICGKNRFFLALLLTCFSLFYLICFFYHFNQDAFLDFSLLYINSTIIFHKSSFTVYQARTQPAVLGGTLLFLSWFLYIVIRFKIFTRNTQKKKSILYPIIFLPVFFLLINTRIPVADEFINFSRSVNTYIKEQKNMARMKKLMSQPFPYKKNNIKQYFKSEKQKPDIFLILLESFNQLLIEKKASNNKTITPFFNSLISRGEYYEHFYSNGMQTSRGLFGIFSGIYPSYRKKIYVGYPNFTYRAFPQILKDNGYGTIFYNAHWDKNFDGKMDNLLKSGFDEFIPMWGEIISGVPKNKIWNWGIQDDEFFKLAFKHLDRNGKRLRKNRNQPIFAAFFTVTQHYPHNHVPKSQRYIFPNARPEETKKHFINSQYLTDKFLEEFFRQLETRPRFRDAIIIITSDHGFPFGQHVIYNEKGFYEENFRVPLLIIWKNRIKPSRVKGVAYSHLDIAPTILDLAGISEPNHFIGRSIFGPRVQVPICLSQPYDNFYHAAVNYPYKYVKSVNLNREMLFNLADDPSEKNNLAGYPEHKEEMEQGRQSIRQLMINQILIDENRVWGNKE